MKSVKLFCMFLCLSMFLPSVNAQQEPPPPVFTLSFNNKAPKTGDVIEVILKASVPKGMHMYSTYNKCDIGPLKLELFFEKYVSRHVSNIQFSHRRCTGKEYNHDFCFFTIFNYLSFFYQLLLRFINGLFVLYSSQILSTDMLRISKHSEQSNLKPRLLYE